MNTIDKNNVLDLAAYFKRINFEGSVEPSLSCLNLLHRLHQESIPFENLDVLLGQSISMELPDIVDKLINRTRGGYCFEQNTLFSAVLQKIGFRVSPYLARVRWMAAADVATPLSHMVLSVETEDGPYLADVGFGGIALVEPIALNSRTSQHLDFEPRRIVDRDAQLIHQVEIDGEWRDVYQFFPTPVSAIDLDVGNWYSFTHPQARFRNMLIVARLTQSGRLVLSNSELIEREWGAQLRRTKVSSEAERHAILRDRFNLSFSAGTRFEIPGESGFSG